ncbi:hypothetical protein ILUMI_09407, partial [Ignelater luminosus]
LPQVENKLVYLWHKLLVHGPDIISFFIMLIERLPEEALDGRHKDIKYLREHTRKTSRLNTNKDLKKMTVLSSDPYLSTLRQHWMLDYLI